MADGFANPDESSTVSNREFYFEPANSALQGAGMKGKDIGQRNMDYARSEGR